MVERVESSTVQKGVKRLVPKGQGWRVSAGVTPRECVMLKGSRDGVAVIIHERAPIETAVRELRKKLAAAGDFFRGAVFSLEWGDRRLTPEEHHALSETIEEFGIHLRVVERTGDEASLPDDRKGAALEGVDLSRRQGGERAGEEGALLVRRTLRSGQRIEHDGSVVVMGDVNAGAVVMSTGDIIVLGALRGLAHAGAAGNTEAIVMAFRLEPTQLRIAHYISRAPDGAGPRPEGPEVARVKNEMIQIEAYVSR